MCAASWCLLRFPGGHPQTPYRRYLAEALVRAPLGAVHFSVDRAKVAEAAQAAAAEVVLRVETIWSTRP